MKRLFVSDTFTRVLSLILAIFLWAFVVIALNPQLDITIIGVPVVYSDTEGLASNNLVIINDQQMKVDVHLRGTRNALALVNNQNITAVVDLSGYHMIGDHYIPINIKLPVDGVIVTSKRPENVQVVIDKSLAVKKPLVLNVEGSPKQGYITSNPHLAQDFVTVQGPESILKTIDKAVARIKVTDKEDDVIEMSDISFVSANGVPVTSDRIGATPSKVEVRCSILYRKTVTVHVPLIGINEASLKVSATAPIYNEIAIIGKTADINAIAAIETEPIDITKITASGEVQAKLVLPQNVTTEPNIQQIGVTILVEVQVITNEN